MKIRTNSFGKLGNALYMISDKSNELTNIIIIIKIHPDSAFPRVPSDLALVEFDVPFYKKDWNWKTKENAIYPICLPGNSYREIGKMSNNLHFVRFQTNLIFQVL